MSDLETILNAINYGRDIERDAADSKCGALSRANFFMIGLILGIGVGISFGWVLFT